MSHDRPWFSDEEDVAPIREQSTHFLIGHLKDGQAVAIGEAGPFEVTKKGFYKGWIKRWPLEACLAKKIVFGDWEGPCEESVVGPPIYSLVPRDEFPGPLIDELDDPKAFLDELNRQELRFLYSDEELEVWRHLAELNGESFPV